MTANLTFNPTLTTSAPGTFGVTWDGLITGTAYPDPSTRFNLSSGVLLNSETIPMWGGVGIYEDVPPAATFTDTLGGSLSTPIALGGGVGRANIIAYTNATSKSLAGFSVFDQAYGMINFPQSPVPQIGSYGQVMFYRLGSGARIALPINAALATTLQQGQTTQPVSWDFNNQVIIPYVAAYSADVITNATWNSTTGVVTITLTTGGELAVGDVFTISGIVVTGQGSNGVSYNGTFTAISPTSTTTLTYQGLAGTNNNPGTYSSGGSLLAGGGAIPGAKILRTYASGCMTPVYNASTGFLTWNYNGPAAIIALGPAN